MRAIRLCEGLTVVNFRQVEELCLPFIPARIKAGFPSPAQDFTEEDIDLVELLGMNKPSVFVVRVDGDSMTDAHIPDKSYLVVDRSLRPQKGDVVVAVLNGEFTVKELVITPAGPVLYPHSAMLNPIPIREGDDFHVWGVVAQVLIDRREMRKRY